MQTYTFFISLLTTFSLIVSVPAKGAGVMRTCVLKEGVSLSSQIKAANTIYKVSSNFNLKGAEITIKEHQLF